MQTGPRHGKIRPQSSSMMASASGVAQARVRYGYRKIRVLLKREGWKVGKYLVERIYREEGLTLHKRRKSLRRVAGHRRERFHPTSPNQVWSMDFVVDQLADGKRFRSLTVVDIHTRECLAIESEQRLKGEDVVLALNRIKIQRGVPKLLYCDNGSEFSSQAMDLCAYQNGVRIAFSRPGKPRIMPSWNRLTERFGQNA
jgi:putative transposase